MDGLLIVDKPAGITSHEVVARMRRTLGERRIGHTGTLDPAATGVLPLVLGRATRLARFLSAGDKAYEAVVRLGRSTDTRDAEGAVIGLPYDGPLPSHEEIEQALDAFRGTFVQQPPAYSAKKVDGQRSYVLARRRARGGAASASEEAAIDAVPRELPAAVSVTTHSIQLLACQGPDVTLRVACSAGFYVRSLAHDLGERLGTGAHLFALRRTRSSDLTLDQAVPLEELERDPSRAHGALIPLARMLPALSSVTLTPDGVRHASQGRDLGDADFAGIVTPAPWLRLVDPDGSLIGLATPVEASGLLHPSVVLV